MSKKTPKVVIEPKWYRSISEMPLSRFIDAKVDNNLYALVISGDVPMQTLQQAWDEILFQYSHAIGNNEYRMYSMLVKQVSELTITLDQIYSLIKVLKGTYVKQFAAMLNDLLRTSFKFDVRMPKDYDNDLKRAHSRSKGMKITLDLKTIQLTGMQKKFAGRGDQALTRDYFQSVLITLSDHVKYQISETITVYEYCERIKRLNRHFETLKQRK